MYRLQMHAWWSVIIYEYRSCQCLYVNLSRKGVHLPNNAWTKCSDPINIDYSRLYHAYLLQCLQASNIIIRTSGVLCFAKIRSQIPIQVLEKYQDPCQIAKVRSPMSNCLPAYRLIHEGFSLARHQVMVYTTTSETHSSMRIQHLYSSKACIYKSKYTVYVPSSAG